MQLKQINRLPMPTWRWLNVNGADLDAPIEGTNDRAPRIQGGEKLDIRPSAHCVPMASLLPDMERMRQAVADGVNQPLTITLPRGMQVTEPVVIEFVLDEGNRHLADYIHIRAEEGSRATVVISYRSAGGEACLHSGFVHLELQPGAEVKLVKAQMLRQQDVHMDLTALELAEGARAELLLVEMGSGSTVAACNVLLAGDRSSAQLDGLYIGDGEKVMDFNYRIEYRGKETEGMISVKGALADRAKKTLKSTVDFVSGAAGAKGREEETVLALSDKVVNLSAPLLLCGEDDVEGEHATTTGRPDENTLFYLMSRGFSEREAKQLLVEAAFTPLVNKIEIEELREDILYRTREVIRGEA